MPSQLSSPTEYDNASALASRSYSKEDLQTIYEIICLATLVPSDYAFRCIWRAYETVLRYKDIDPAHDSKFFRVLINLGGGGSLLDKFKNFLKENGFDSSTVEHLHAPDARLVSLYTRSRFLEAKDRRDRTTSTASNSPADDDADTGDYTNGSDILREQRRKYISTRRQEKREARDLEERQPAARDSRRSERNRGSPGMRQSGLAYASTIRHLSSVFGDTSQDSHSINPPKRTTSSEYRALIEDDAGFARQVLLSRKYFGLWHSRAVQQAERRRHLEQIAIDQDRRVLAREALTEWLFLTKERQTEQARNIYLAGAVFSTWAHKTAAIINRSNEMRQRIMARKYFNAWRSIVLENEARIRKFQLMSAIYRWRMALFRRRQQEEHASQVYQVNLVSRFRKLWWYRACEVVAPGLHINFLMQEALSTWHQQTSAIVHNKQVANRLYRSRLANRMFQHWLERTDDVLDMEEDAVDHRDWSVTRKHLDTWRRRTKYAPAIAHMVDRVNRRLAADILDTWRLRSRQSATANALLKTNTLKHALRAWNLHLTLNSFVARQQERVLVDTLYCWVLKTRYEIFTKRVKNWLLAKNALSNWRQQTKTSLKKRRKNNRNALCSLKHHLLSKLLHAWRDRLAQETDREAQAEQLYKANLARKVLGIWTARERDIFTLQSWVAPSRKYLLLRNHMALWRSALQRAKRHNIKRAYKQFYHNRKHRLLASVMNHWYSRAQVIHAMTVSAEDFNSSSVALTAQRAIGVWRDRLNHVNQLNQIQQSWNNPPLLTWALDRWLLYLEHVTNLNDLGENYRDARVTSAAATLFRRWQTKGFVLRTRETTAELMSERIEKRRIVGLVRVWVERAREKEGFRKFEERLEQDEQEEHYNLLEKELLSGTSTNWESARQTGLGRNEQSDDSLVVDEDADDYEQPDVSPTPTPLPFRSSGNVFSSRAPITPYRSSTRREHASENLIDLRTPYPLTASPSRRKPPRASGRSPTRLRGDRTPFPNTPFLSSIPALQPNVRSSIFSSKTPRPAPEQPQHLHQQVLQTPGARAARARELLFKMTPAPLRLAQALPPRPPQEDSHNQPPSPPERTETIPPKTSSSPSPRATTPEGGVPLHLADSATPEGSPVRQPPAQAQGQVTTSTPMGKSGLLGETPQTAFKFGTTRLVRFMGVSAAGSSTARSLFGMPSLEKGKGRELRGE